MAKKRKQRKRTRQLMVKPTPIPVTKMVAVMAVPGTDFTVDSLIVGSYTWKGPAIVPPGSELVLKREGPLVVMSLRT